MKVFVQMRFLPTCYCLIFLVPAESVLGSSGLSQRKSGTNMYSLDDSSKSSSKYLLNSDTPKRLLRRRSNEPKGSTTVKRDRSVLDKEINLVDYLRANVMFLRDFEGQCSSRVEEVRSKLCCLLQELPLASRSQILCSAVYDILGCDCYYKSMGKNNSVHSFIYGVLEK